MKKAVHIGIILLLLFVFMGIPSLRYHEQIIALLDGRIDAVSSATLELPDQPSGEFVVLLNKEKHPDTITVWEDFFCERPVDVIFEDLQCLVVDTDADGIQLAERYQARLAEHQMELRRENGLLVVSKAQWGVFDVLILSAEMAEVYHLETVQSPDTAWLTVKGGGL